MNHVEHKIESMYFFILQMLANIASITKSCAYQNFVLIIMALPFCLSIAKKMNTKEAAKPSQNEGMCKIWRRSQMVYYVENLLIIVLNNK